MADVVHARLTTIPRNSIAFGQSIESNIVIAINVFENAALIDLQTPSHTCFSSPANPQSTSKRPTK